jgi:UDP-N-acetylmuramoylalanine--D-glutamate ligase
VQDLKDRPVLILGLGLSGLAMARWCARCGAQVTVADTREAPPQLDALREHVPAAKFISGAFGEALLEGVDAVFRSPGLSPDQVAPVVGPAAQRDLHVGGELGLFAAALASLRAEQAYAPAMPMRRPSWP